MSKALCEFIREKQLQGLHLQNIDLKNAESAQTDYINRICNRLPPPEVSKFRERLNSLDVPTNLQSLPHFLSLENVYKTVDEYMNSQGRGLEVSPLLATAYGGDLNGQVLRDEVGNYAILLDESYLIHCSVLAKLLLPAVTPTSIPSSEPLFADDSPTIKKRLENNPISQTLFDSCIISYLCDGTTSTSVYSDLPNDQILRLIAANITEGVKLNLVGHEYGHIALGHMENEEILGIISSNELHKPTQFKDAPNYKIQHFMEWQADLIGLDTCIQTSEHSGVLQMRLLGILGNYYISQIFYNAICMWTLGKGVYAALLGADDVGSKIYRPLEFSSLQVLSHPHGSVRAGYIIDYLLESNLSGDEKDIISTIDNMVQKYLTELWVGFINSIDDETISDNPLSVCWEEASDDIAQFMLESVFAQLKPEPQPSP